MSGGVIGTRSCSRLSLVTLARGRALGAGTTVSGVLVDSVPDRLPDRMELGLDESDDGGLGGEDALFELLLVLSEERL